MVVKTTTLEKDVYVEIIYNFWKEKHIKLIYKNTHINQIHYMTINESTRKTRFKEAYATTRARIRGQYGWNTKTETQRFDPYRYFRTRKTERKVSICETKQSETLQTSVSNQMFFPFQFLHRYFQPCTQRRIRPDPDGESITNTQGH